MTAAGAGFAAVSRNAADEVDGIVKYPPSRGGSGGGGGAGSRDEAGVPFPDNSTDRGPYVGGMSGDGGGNQGLGNPSEWDPPPPELSYGRPQQQQQQQQQPRTQSSQQPATLPRTDASIQGDAQRVVRNQAPPTVQIPPPVSGYSDSNGGGGDRDSSTLPAVSPASRWAPAPSPSPVRTYCLTL